MSIVKPCGNCGFRDHMFYYGMRKLLSQGKRVIQIFLLTPGTISAELLIYILALPMVYIEEEKMGKCARHKKRETDYICMKDRIYMCVECLKCRHPDDYCKFRTACAIWFAVEEESETKKKLSK